MKWMQGFITTGLLGLAALRLFSASSTQPSDNGLFEQLRGVFEKWRSTLPEERVYLQFDKSLYKPGEDIWFTGYVRQAENFAKAGKSDILNVELIDPRGNTVTQHQLILDNGTVKGDFSLDETMPGGLYKVKAYTEWQKNQADPAFFEKDLQVQHVVLPRLKMTMDFQKEAYGPGDNVIAATTFETNDNQRLANKKVSYSLSVDGEEVASGTARTDNQGKTYLQDQLPSELSTPDGLLTAKVDYEGQTESISRSVPIVLNHIQLAFYPEGGDLVHGLKTKVAFRAVDENNEPADISGKVLNSNDEVVTSFSSFHDGMGAFPFTPAQNENYKVRITEPAGIDSTYSLPAILPKGYVLNATQNDKGSLKLAVRSSENEELFIVGTSRGRICYEKTIQSHEKGKELSVAENEFPMGVARFTLFDSHGIERAERLVFMNRHKQLNVAITTDKERYLPREKVNMTINVRDDRGVPVPATLSMAVVDDQHLSFADDRSGKMLYRMLVAPEIKGDIHQPSFYFKPDEVKAPQALDYVLMTAGWRRFTWEEMRQEEPTVKHAAEQSIVAGRVVKGRINTVLPELTVKVEQTGQQVVTDQQGRFSFPNLDLTEPKTLVVTRNDDLMARQRVTAYRQDIRLDVLQERSIRSRILNNEEDVHYMMDEPARNEAAVAERDMAEKQQVVEDGEADGQPGALDVAQEEAALPIDQDEQEGDGEVADQRAERLAHEKKKEARQAAQTTAYYHGREFPAPIYDKNEIPENRTDFRSTVYWNGRIEVDRTGSKTVSFYNGDRISSFRATVEGIGANGQLAHAEETYHTQLPLSVTTKLPGELVEGDEVSIPLTLKNQTASLLEGQLAIELPEGLSPIEELPDSFSLIANDARTIYLPLQVTGANQEDTLKVTARAGGLRDGFTKSITMQSRGFPVKKSFSGQQQEASYRFSLDNVVEGSLTANVTAYPTIMNELLSGVEGILSEPHGCFEQASASSYPNILALEYMQEMDENEPELMARAQQLMDKGYQKLVTYETEQKGYEWFGKAPGHEGLTAYGLMQFNDMKRVYSDVNQEMIDRTAEWLMSRKDGNGGFKLNDKALDSYGRAEKDISNAYIVYALSEAGYRDIDQEVANVYEQALSTEDPYLLALAANALMNRHDERSGKVLDKLTEQQQEDGSWQGAKHSITRSTGRNLSIETTSLALMALVKADQPDGRAINEGVSFLMKQRSGQGRFGSTQATILALKALAEYAKFAKRTSESGTIVLYVNGQKIDSRSYEAGETEPIEMTGWDNHLQDGSNTVQIAFDDVDEPLPFTVALDYHTTLPNSSEETQVDLSTTLASSEVSVGETVRLSTELRNTTSDGLPMTMAIVGMPAGLSAQPWQLQELQQQNKVDFYEVVGNNVVFYYRQMKPDEKRTIDLDLKAEMPGTFQAPASSGYLYYSDDHKVWTAMDEVTITR